MNYFYIKNNKKIMDVSLVHQQTGYNFQISQFSLLSFIYEVASKVFQIPINSIELYYQDKIVPNSDINAFQYFKNFPILIQVKDLTKAGSTSKADQKQIKKKYYVKCQICRLKKSIFYCRQCNQFVCFECNVRYPEHYEHQKINLESGDLLLCFEEYRSIIIKRLDVLCNAYKLSKENIIDILERREIFEKLIETLKELDKKTGQLTAMETSFKCTDQLFKMYNTNLREIEPPKFIEDTEGCFSIINEREHEMREFIPFINLQIIKSQFNVKMFEFIKNIQELFNNLMNSINSKLNESTKLYSMTYDDIVQYNNQRINEDKESDSDSDFSKKLKLPDNDNNNAKNNKNINEDKISNNNNSTLSTKSIVNNKKEEKNDENKNNSNNINYNDISNIPSIFSSKKKKEKKEKEMEKTEIKSKKKLFPLLMDSNKKKSKMNLLNKIKENAMNNEKKIKDEINVINEEHSNILLKTILNKKIKKKNNINAFPLIKTMKKNENKSEINIRSLNENKNNNNNKLFLSHENINNLNKSKSHLKLKICDTINTKIKNLKFNNKIKTENDLKIKKKERKTSFHKNKISFSG